MNQTDNKNLMLKYENVNTRYDKLVQKVTIMVDRLEQARKILERLGFSDDENAKEELLKFEEKWKKLHSEAENGLFEIDEKLSKIEQNLF